MESGIPTQRTAVLVIDLQNENWHNGAWPVLDYRGVLANAGKAIGACRAHGIPIVYSRHWLDPKGRNAMKYEPLDPNGRPLHSVAGDPMGEISEAVRPHETDIVVDKQRFTAFYDTNLDIVLNRMDANHLIMMGVWTEACLETTVWDALWRDYRITLVKDACGTSTATVHRAAVLDMANWLYGGTIVCADELVKALEGKPYKAWNFERPNSFPYTLETLDRMYESI